MVEQNLMRDALNRLWALYDAARPVSVTDGDGASVDEWQAFHEAVANVPEISRAALTAALGAEGVRSTTGRAELARGSLYALAVAMIGISSEYQDRGVEILAADLAMAFRHAGLPLPAAPTPPPPVGEVVTIEIVVSADPANVIDARLVRRGDTAAEIVARHMAQRTENGNVQSFVLTAKIPLPPKPTVPTVVATVEPGERG